MRKGRQQEKWESDGFLIRLEDENCWANFTEEKKKKIEKCVFRFKLNLCSWIDFLYCEWWHVFLVIKLFGPTKEILLSILIEINKYHRFSVYQISCLKWMTCILFSFSCLWSAEKLRKVFFPSYYFGFETSFQ